MVNNEESEGYRYRVAYALNILLVRNKKKHGKNKKQGIEDLLLDHSFDRISSRTGLRVATISAIFNGTVDPKFSTVSLILGSLGVSFAQFGKILDGISDSEAKAYVKSRGK